MLHLHRAERADALTGPLADLLADPPDDALAADVVAVPTRGVERWLAQRLSHRLGTGPRGEAGVCAGVHFPSPAALVAGVTATVLDVDPTEDPWQVDRLVWSLLAVVDECAGQAWCSSLSRHLGYAGTWADDGTDHHRRARRFSATRHIAMLFASYGAQRPDLLRAWAVGEDNTDGAGGRAPADLRWQPELFRRLRERLASPSPAERLDQAVRLLADDPGRVPLPSRLSVFGPTRLPHDQLTVLTALARHRDVHLWLLHPSPVLWAATAAAATPAAHRRADHPRTARHPLLASLGRDSYEMQIRLAHLAPGAADEHHGGSAPPATLLGDLQSHVRDDVRPAAQPRRLTEADRSVQVHACHGRARQVEVLRDVLVGLFAADPALEPRDVLVMCPDIEEFAPLVSATFGLASDEEPAATLAHPGHRLRVRLADRSLRQTNPLLSLLSRLLELASSRVTASEVLDLAASAPVRRRFALRDDDLDRLRDWVTASGARWGENRYRRSTFGLTAVGQNTWDAALDRILLGAAMADEDQRYIGSALPLDDVDSTDLDLAGRLAELLDRLTEVLGRLSGTHPLGEWLDTLDVAMDLLADTTPTEGWQLVQARRVLADVSLAGERSGSMALGLADMGALLAGRLEGRPTRASFRTGHLTMCSLVPMRSVPHRVVCLLGMDEGSFPRGAAVDGDDLLLRDPLVGERDRRSEDRQLLLDAVLAAGDHLVVLYTGADERTGAVRAPAVPVGEVLDVLDQMALAPDGRPARAHVVVRHPLQPFDPRGFTAGALGVPGPFSFDRPALAGARAARANRVDPPPFLRGRLPAGPREGEPVQLDRLRRFLEHPARDFLRTRLGVVLAREEDDIRDRLPLELDALQRWAVGDRLLAARLSGAGRVESLEAEWRRGEVPPQTLGLAMLHEMQAQVDPLVAAARTVRSANGPVAHDIVADLPGAPVLTGTVAGVFGAVLVRATYSRLRPKHRLDAWVQLLALAAARPDQSWSAVTVGRSAGNRPAPRASVLTAPPARRAAALLAELLDLYARGLREPLPLVVGASASYAASRAAGDVVPQARDAASKAWSPFDADNHLRLVWGEDVGLQHLLAPSPRTDEAGWSDDDTRFGVLSRRIWEPLLAAEQSRSL